MNQQWTLPHLQSFTYIYRFYRWFSHFNAHWSLHLLRGFPSHIWWNRGTPSSTPNPARQRHLQVLLSKARLVLVLRIFGLSAQSLWSLLLLIWWFLCVWYLATPYIVKKILMFEWYTPRYLDWWSKTFKVWWSKTHFGLNPHFWLITKKSNIVQSMLRGLNMSE